MSEQDTRTQDAQALAHVLALADALTQAAAEASYGGGMTLAGQYWDEDADDWQDSDAGRQARALARTLDDLARATMLAEAAALELAHGTTHAGAARMRAHVARWCEADGVSTQADAQADCK